MIKTITSNIIWASNLIFTTAVLSLIGILLNGTFTQADEFYIDSLLNIGVLVVLAYLIRLDYKWARWLFAVPFIWNLFGLIWFLPILFQINVISGYILILQILLQISALFLFFVKPKEI